jgi:hypothetical protein
LNQYDQNKLSSGDKSAAYEQAFSPQIDFSSSLSWFIAKASQEALEAQRSQKR